MTDKNQIVIEVDPKFMKRVPDPHDTRRWNYVGTIPALEAVKLVRGTANPREANLGSKVAEDIRDSIHNAPTEFHLRNRGLIVTASDASLDTERRKLTLENPRAENDSILWGILDGGHTYKVLCEEHEFAKDGNNNGSSGMDAMKHTWVDIKIRLGLNKDEVISAAAANNTSAQLRPWTLANFKGQLEPLRRMVQRHLPEHSGNIAFKENEINEETGQERYWDVLDLLQRMTLLNTQLFPGFDASRHPVIAYASKSKVLDLFLKEPDSFASMAGIVADAFRMPAIVESKLTHSKKIHGNLAFANKAKPGEIDGTLKGKPNLTRRYRISDAVLFPTVAALRPLIDDSGGKLTWRIEPVEFLDRNVETLMQAFLGYYKENVEDKTNKASLSGMGKDIGLWQTMHATVLGILARPKTRAI
jgi:AIPR protein